MTQPHTVRIVVTVTEENKDAREVYSSAFELVDKESALRRGRTFARLILRKTSLANGKDPAVTFRLQQATWADLTEDEVPRYKH